MRWPRAVERSSASVSNPVLQTPDTEVRVALGWFLATPSWHDSGPRARVDLCRVSNSVSMPLRIINKPAILFMAGPAEPAF